MLSTPSNRKAFWNARLPFTLNAPLNPMLCSREVPSTKYHSNTEKSRGQVLTSTNSAARYTRSNVTRAALTRAKGEASWSCITSSNASTAFVAFCPSRAVTCSTTSRRASLGVHTRSYVFEGLRCINSTTNPPNPTTCATRMVATVVSTPTRDRIIIDGGQKTFERRPPNPYGHIVEHPEARIYGMSVEHGHVDVSASNHKFRVGERLSVVAGHQGITINHHDEVYAFRSGILEAVWPVAGWGRVR